MSYVLARAASADIKVVKAILYKKGLEWNNPDHQQLIAESLGHLSVLWGLIHIIMMDRGWKPEKALTPNGWYRSEEDAVLTNSLFAEALTKVAKRKYTRAEMNMLRILILTSQLSQLPYHPLSQDCPNWAERPIDSWIISAGESFPPLKRGLINSIKTSIAEWAIELQKI